MKLITIPISHYCERARWALDLAQLSYEEEHHLPIFQARASRSAGGTGFVPVLQHGDDSFTDSAAIVRYASERGANLYPPEHESTIAELEERFAGDLGVESRRWVYYYVLPCSDLLIGGGSGNAPRWQVTALRLAYPLAKRLASKRFGLSPEAARRSVDIVQREFDFAASLLKGGRPYFCGDTFTAADLSFAALAAPVVFPKNYGFRLPELAELPSAMAAQIAAFREHPAGQFTLRTYESRPRSPLRSDLA